MNNMNWKPFRVDELFTIKRGKRLIASDRKKGRIPYYSASKENNGLTDFISNPLFVESNKIIFTTFGDSFYVNGTFTASDEVTILGNDRLNALSAKFIVTCLMQNSKKFMFGYKAFTNRVSALSILLPVTQNKEPNWEFMESYIHSKMNQIRNLYHMPSLYRINDERSLKEVEWDEFTLDSISKVTGGKDWEAYNRIPGNSPFVGSSSVNNGITDFVDFTGRENQVGEKVIGINRNGSVGYAFYHPYKAYFSGDTRFIKLADFGDSKFVNHFIATMIMKQKDKYAFGYKMGTARIKRQIIKLPAKNGKPDFVFMEQYMKRIENKIILNIRKID